MIRRLVIPLLALALVGCPRQVTLDIHHPEECAGDPPADCPLRGITHFQTRLVRVDGTLVPLPDGCQEAPGGLCTYQDLASVVFVDNISRPADAIEIRIDGIAGEGCEPPALTIFRCESFGDTVVDLELDDRVPIWCDCPVNRVPVDP